MSLDAPRLPTADSTGLAGSLARRPTALLLDFGGVIFSTVKRADGRRDAARHLHEALARAGHVIDEDRILESLQAGLTALKHWKHSMSRTQRPREFTHRELWEEFLLADLPVPARAMAAGNGETWLAEINPLLSDHVVRDGIPELLELARRLDVPVGIVSNAHSGVAHRSLLAKHDLERFFAVQLYSDECGIRKPNPEILWQAAAALSTTVDQCWYVGDCQDRDLVAGRRAGVGAVVLTRSKHTDNPPFPVHGVADAVFEDPTGLIEVLAESQLESDATATIPSMVNRLSTPSKVPEPPAAMLFDQGGVLYTTEPTPDRLGEFVADVAHRLSRASHTISEPMLADAIDRARDAYRDLKNAPAQADGSVPEVAAREFWADLVGVQFDPAARAWFGAEAPWLAAGYTWSKSRPTLRPGVRELLSFCAEQGIATAVVSNTQSARTARRRLAEFGISEQLPIRVYSDELGLRKPGPEPVLEATRALGVDPEQCWFVGDKPWRDVAAGRAAAVGTTVIVRGGSPDDHQLDEAAQTAPPDLLATDLFDVLRALEQTLSAAA